MLPLVALAAQLVPGLIHIIANDKGGSIAQAVSQAVSDITGTTDPVAAKEKLAADAATSVSLQQKLAEIALEATKAQLSDADQQRQADLATIKASNENTAGARSTFQVLASAGSPLAWGSPVVSVVVTLGFFVILTLILYHGIPALNGNPPDATVVNIVNVSVGVLGTAFATVVNFWLGSSSSSRNKDAQVVELQNSHAQQTNSILKALQTAQDVHTQNAQLALKTVENVASNAISGAAPTANVAIVAPAPRVDDFDRCVGITLAFEGGFVENASDAGGATNFGITLGTLRSVRNDNQLTAEDIRKLTRGEAIEIYRTGYWRPAACGDLPPGVDLMVFDFGVNSGPRTSVQCLQRVVGVTDDGSIGPKTLAAVQGQDVKTLISALSEARLAYLRGLSNFGEFGTGWTNRVTQLTASALAMV